MASGSALCRHDLIPDSCAVCTPRPGAGQPIPGHGMTARHVSRCPGCGEQIVPGDWIVPDPDGFGWLGECCQ